MQNVVLPLGGVIGWGVAYVAYTHADAFQKVRPLLMLAIVSVFMLVYAFIIGYHEGSAAAGRRLLGPIPPHFVMLVSAACILYVEFCARWLTTLKGGVDKVSEERRDTDAD